MASIDMLGCCAWEEDVVGGAVNWAGHEGLNPITDYETGD